MSEISRWHGAYNKTYFIVMNLYCKSKIFLFMNKHFLSQKKQQSEWIRRTDFYSFICFAFAMPQSKVLGHKRFTFRRRRFNEFSVSVLVKLFAFDFALQPKYIKLLNIFFCDLIKSKTFIFTFTAAKRTSCKSNFQKPNKYSYLQ